MQIVKKQTKRGGGREKETRRGIKTNNCCTIAAACEGVQGRGKWGIHIFDAEKYLQINCHSRQGERGTETDREREGGGGNRETAAASQDPKMANKRSWPGCE